MLNADTSRLVAERARQTILATATDALISVDSAGAVVDWNTAAEQLFGFGAAEAVGRELWTLIVPERLVDHHRHGVAQAALGAPSSLIGQRTEVPALHKDGRELAVELTVWSTPAGDGELHFHAFCRDIGERLASQTALMEANRQLAESRQQLEDAFEASPTAEAIVDTAGVLVAVNPEMCRFLESEADALLGRAWVVLLHEPDSSRAERLMSEVQESGRVVSRAEVRCVTADGRVVWGLVTMSAMGAEAPASRVVIRIEDIQDYKDLQSALVRQASHDAVSGLPNRDMFVERVRQALAQPQAEPIAIAVLVVEGLHDVIDRDGFAAGDAVLAKLAQRIVDRLDPGVMVAHLRTGQFGVLVPPGPLDAVSLAGRLLAATEMPFDLPAVSYR